MSDDEAMLTVEQLAQETAMTVRNIRNHQSRGLLPPPEVRARVGYYGAAHVERLRLVQQMQAAGLKLAAIERLLAQGNGAAEYFMGVQRAVAPSEQPEILTAAELAEQFGDDDPATLDRAVALGLLVPLGDGNYEALRPSLMRAGEEVLGCGLSLRGTLKALEQLQRDAHRSSEGFMRLFREELWEPFDAAGRREEDWAVLTESLERLKPLALEAAAVFFQQEMAAAIEDSLRQTIDRAPGRSAGRKTRKRPPRTPVPEPEEPNTARGLALVKEQHG